VVEAGFAPPQLASATVAPSERWHHTEREAVVEPHAAGTLQPEEAHEYEQLE